MSVERCAVPNCTNSATTGIPFPKQKDLLETWLESLKIPHLVPNSRSFVCLNHFGEGDILERLSDAGLENVLEELPIPVLISNNEEEEEVKTESQSSTKIVEDGPAVCRLCMSQYVYKRVSDDCGENLTISALITTLIPQIKIEENDGLSEWVCVKCLQVLQQFRKFVNNCLEKEQRQRDSVNNTSKRKVIEGPCVLNVKRICTNSQPVQYKSDLDRKFDDVEAELMKALEGQIPEEMRNADNIIIEVQSDDESDQTNEVSIEGNTVRVGSNEVRLPKGIKVSVSQPVCTEQSIEEIDNSEFCLIDNYLFEYRLCKGDVRHLRCLVPKCKAAAQQTLIEPGIYQTKVLLKMSHNHPAPSIDERKRQMFLHLMRRRMQNDKTLNFRGVYDELCEKDPEIRRLVPLKSVINQICCQQMNLKSPPMFSFDQFFELIETDDLQKLHFTHSNSQFYQEKFAGSDGSKAVVFANYDTIEKVSDSKIMYVDASFKINTLEEFKYHLVSVLVWVSDSYYPIMFALINEKSQELYKLIFSYLRDNLAPKLRPEEIVTDYEACLYYSLGEVYLDSHIGGSVFYYTQNLYKKICSLKLSRELETNSCFRNIYHMILMLPLLPVNTILDGLTNIEQQAVEMGQDELAAPIFEYVKTEWINKVTPDLFCVHRLENRINENVIAPFKKLRDFIMLSKGKMHRQQINIVSVVEKLIELEGFLSVVYSAPTKKSFARDLSSSQKKNVIRAWQFIETHPKININNFFTKVLGYIKCMENQLWIWGFYRYTGDVNDELINAANFSIVNSNDEDDHNYQQQAEYGNYMYPENDVVLDIIVDQKDGFLVKQAQVEEEVMIQSQDNMVVENEVNLENSYME